MSENNDDDELAMVDRSKPYKPRKSRLKIIRRIGSGETHYTNDDLEIIKYLLK
jgi:hypothetical protein